MKTKAAAGPFMMVTLLLILHSVTLNAQSIPQLLNYQGRLLDSMGQPVADGTTVDMTFAFYGVETGGTVYLTVLQEDVVVTDGVYNVLIGSGMVTPVTESSLASVLPIKFRLDAEKSRCRPFISPNPFDASSPILSSPTVGFSLFKTKR